MGELPVQDLGEFRGDECGDTFLLGMLLILWWAKMRLSSTFDSEVNKRLTGVQVCQGGMNPDEFTYTGLRSQVLLRHGIRGTQRVLLSVTQRVSQSVTNRHWNRIESLETDQYT